MINVGGGATPLFYGDPIQTTKTKSGVAWKDLPGFAIADNPADAVVLGYELIAQQRWG
jgi:hypothetical protein